MDGRIGKWIDGWMDGWMDGRIRKWMEGWMKTIEEVEDRELYTRPGSLAGLAE